MMKKTYKIGSAAVSTAVADEGTVEINPTESREIISIELETAATLKLGGKAAPQVGDEIILKVTSDGTARDLTFGTGFVAPVLAGAGNKTKTITLVYDGGDYIATGASVQLD